MVATAALLAAACAPGMGATGQNGTAAFAQVVIENDNTSSMTVYAARTAGTRSRLGTVPALSTETFDIRRSMVGPTGELRILVEPFGTSRAYASDAIFVQEGDVLELVVSHMIR